MTSGETGCLHCHTLQHSLPDTARERHDRPKSNSTSNILRLFMSLSKKRSKKINSFCQIDRDILS